MMTGNKNILYELIILINITYLYYLSGIIIKTDLSRNFNRINCLTIQNVLLEFLKYF